jgi:transposase, IS5 family
LPKDGPTPAPIVARLANIVPALILARGVGLVVHLPAGLATAIHNVANAFIILTIILAMNAALNLANRLYQRRPDAEKTAIKEGRVPEEWKPAKARQKDRDARWSIKYSKAKVREGTDPKAAKPVDLAIPMFGYKNHIGIDKAHGLIRTWGASAANAHDGARLPDLISKGNTGSGVWADTAYRSKKNEAFLAAGMFKSHIHQRRKPRQPMPERIAKANTRRSKIRAQVEHVFAGQKHRMGLIVRTIGIARATIKIGMANLAYNFQRLVWLEGRTAPA